MLQVTLTPTMITFKDLTDEQHDLLKGFEMEYNDKGYYFIKGTPKELYKTLLKLSYTFDMEVS